MFSILTFCSRDECGSKSRRWRSSSVDVVGAGTPIIFHSRCLIVSFRLHTQQREWIACLIYHNSTREIQPFPMVVSLVLAKLVSKYQSSTRNVSFVVPELFLGTNQTAQSLVVCMFTDILHSVFSLPHTANDWQTCVLCVWRLLLLLLLLLSVFVMFVLYF